MKKYLLALIPLIFGLTLSAIYAFMDPKGYPHHTYPYRTENALAFLKTSWFIIGIGLSATVVGMILVDDAFRAILKYLDNRRWEKHECDRESQK